MTSMADRSKRQSIYNIDKAWKMEGTENLDVGLETPAKEVFIAPSIYKNDILAGVSYTHHSDIPEALKDHMNEECVIGIDEAGRGPVLGMMLMRLGRCSNF